MEHSSIRKIFQYCAIGFAVPAVIAIYTGLNFPPQYDEVAHQHFVQHIAAQPTWHTIVNYEGAENYEAKGPLFFALAAGYGSLAGFSLPALRLFALAFSFLMICAYGVVARGLAIEQKSLAVVCLPYFVILSLTFMTDVAALFFLLIGIAAFATYDRSKQGIWLSLAAAAFTAASYIRIDLLYPLIGIALVCWCSKRFDWKLGLAVAAPFLLRAPLVFIWHGFASPLAQARQNPVGLGFAPAHFVFTLAVLGLYFWPFVLAQCVVSQQRIRCVIATSVAIGLYLLWQPTVSALNTDQYGGTLRSVSLLIDQPFVCASVWVICIAIGLMACFEIILPLASNYGEFSLQAICVAGVVIQIFRGAVFYERYLVGLSVFFLLLFLIRQTKRQYVWLWAFWGCALQGVQLLKDHVLP